LIFCFKAFQKLSTSGLLLGPRWDPDFLQNAKNGVGFLQEETGMALTAKFVDSLKGDPKKRTSHLDTTVEGLELRVGPNGTKAWSLRYRLQGGERRRMSIGPYPLVSLADARARAIRAMATALDGEDPGAPKKQARVEAKVVQQTVASLVAMYFSAPELSSKSASAVAYEKWLWGKHLAHRVGDRALLELKRADVRAIIRDIGANVGHRTGNYAQSVLRQVFNFGIREDILTENPAIFDQLFKMVSRDRVLTQDELTRFWAALEISEHGLGIGFSAQTAIAAKLCILTLQRAGEVMGMHTNEIDLAAKSWTIPAHRSKNRRSHFVPLSDLACKLIEVAIDLNTSGANGYAGPIFPSSTKIGQSSERAVLTRAMKRCCNGLGIVDATPHDLRRTSASMMASELCKVPGEIIARILNHTASGSPVTQIYNRYDYAAEKRDAMNTWAKALSAIVTNDSEPAVD
jgi:integrase